MIFLLKESRGSRRSPADHRSESRLGILNEALSSGARLCFPSRLRFSSGWLKLSRTIQRMVSV